MPVTKTENIRPEHIDTPPDIKNTSTKNGRNYSDISKVVTKVVVGLLLAVTGVLAIAALVVGIMLLINPAGFGIGNAIGGGVAAAGAALSALVIKIAGLAAIHALPITLAGAVALGAVVTSVTSWILASKNENSTVEKIDNSRSSAPEKDKQESTIESEVLHSAESMANEKKGDVTLEEGSDDDNNNSFLETPKPKEPSSPAPTPNITVSDTP